MIIFYSPHTWNSSMRATCTVCLKVSTIACSMKYSGHLTLGREYHYTIKCYIWSIQDTLRSTCKSWHKWAKFTVVTDEGSRPETSQLFVSATIKFCSLMSTFAWLKRSNEPDYYKKHISPFTKNHKMEVGSAWEWDYKTTCEPNYAQELMMEVFVYYCISHSSCIIPG